MHRKIAAAIPGQAMRTAAIQQEEVYQQEVLVSSRNWRETVGERGPMVDNRKSKTRPGRPGTKEPIKGVPFAKAYLFILRLEGLSPAERLLLIVVSRFWPEPSIQSNETLAELCGFSVRYTEKLIRRLKNKGFIKAGYAHRERQGRPHTTRAIMPTCFPKGPKPRLQWIEDRPIGRAKAEQSDGLTPSNRPDSTERPADLIENDHREKKTPPPPVPAEKRAAAAVINAVDVFGAGKRRGRGLSEAEFEQRRQQVSKQLEGQRA